MTLLNSKNWKHGNEVLYDLKEANPKKADKGKIQSAFNLVGDIKLRGIFAKLFKT